MKKWKALVMAMGLFVSMTAAPAQAIKIFDECKAANANSKVCAAADSEKDAADTVKTIIDTLLFALGITAVFMIIWGSIKYVISRGDPANIKAAKETVTYAVVGVIVALMAYAIVNFVIAIF